MLQEEEQQPTSQPKHPRMANLKPFPFLSLPKELRLIIYSFVPAITTHVPIFLPVTDHYSQGCLQLVHTSLPVLPLLLTCRQIHSESHDILREKAASLTSSTLPVRIISTPEGLLCKRLRKILICIALTPLNCPYSCDVEKLAQGEISHEHCSLPLPLGTPKRQVAVALTNPSVRTDGACGYSARMELEQDLQDLGFDLRYCGLEMAKLALHLTVRAALLDGKGEEQMFGEIDAQRSAGHPDWFVSGGKAIGREEWEREWAEG